MKSALFPVPWNLKRHNIERLLATLEHYQPVSRSDLSGLTDMSGASVTRVVNLLMNLGLVREVSVIESAGRGRKAVSLSTASDGILTLGCHIDLGGLHLCLLDFDHTPRISREIPLSPSDFVPERLGQLARQQLIHMMSEDLSRLKWVGVSLSGRIEGRYGHVVRSVALDWTDVDLAKPFSDAFGLPVCVENDVKACLTWESTHRGLTDSVQDIAYLYLGRSGIGFANTVGGQVVRGFHNAAGEIEDISLGMGQSLGQHLMEVSLVNRARVFSPSVETMNDILSAYRMSLVWSKLLIEDFSRHLQALLSVIHALFDPHSIILGGDMMDALRTYPELLPQGDYVFGERFEDSCARGAAVIAMSEALDSLIDGALIADNAQSF